MTAQTAVTLISMGIFTAITLTVGYYLFRVARFYHRIKKRKPNL